MVKEKSMSEMKAFIKKVDRIKGEAAPGTKGGTLTNVCESLGMSTGTYYRYKGILSGKARYERKPSSKQELTPAFVSRVITNDRTEAANKATEVTKIMRIKVLLNAAKELVAQAELLM